MYIRFDGFLTVLVMPTTFPNSLSFSEFVLFLTWLTSENILSTDAEECDKTLSLVIE